MRVTRVSSDGFVEVISDTGASQERSSTSSGSSSRSTSRGTTRTTAGGSSGSRRQYASAFPAARTAPVITLRDGTELPCKATAESAFGLVSCATANGTTRVVAARDVDFGETTFDGDLRPETRRRGASPKSSVEEAPASASSAEAEARAVRRKAPDVRLGAQAKATDHLSALRGKVVVLDFWATWCPACVSALPEVRALAEAHADEDFELVSVSLDEDCEAATKLLASKGIEWPQACDGNGWGAGGTANRYGVDVIPRTVLLDRKGRIAQVDLQGVVLDEWVERLLAE